MPKKVGRAFSDLNSVLGEPEVELGSLQKFIIILVLLNFYSMAWTGSSNYSQCNAYGPDGLSFFLIVTCASIPDCLLGKHPHAAWEEVAG